MVQRKTGRECQCEARHMGKVSFHLASLLEAKLVGNVARHIMNGGYVAFLEHRLPSTRAFPPLLSKQVIANLIPAPAKISQPAARLCRPM
jgi:hypothetical protein